MLLVVPTDIELCKIYAENIIAYYDSGNIFVWLIDLESSVSLGMGWLGKVDSWSFVLTSIRVPSTKTFKKKSKS